MLKIAHCGPSSAIVLPFGDSSGAIVLSLKALAVRGAQSAVRAAQLYFQIALKTTRS